MSEQGSDVILCLVMTNLGVMRGNTPSSQRRYFWCQSSREGERYEGTRIKVVMFGRSERPVRDGIQRN